MLFIHSYHPIGPIEIILAKCCVKFVWSLHNSDWALYSHILRLTLQNGISTMGENIRYLIPKYDILSIDWS